MNFESLYLAGFLFVITGGSMFNSGILLKNTKEIIAIVVVAVLATVCLLFAGCGKKEEVVETKPLTWNGLKFAKELPELKAKKIMVAANEENYLLANFEGVTLEGFNDYIAQCETKGFNVEPKKEEFTYQAYCAKGLELYMIYGNDSICLELKKVREFKDLTWPTEGLATLLPQCSATKGKIKTNTKKEFAVNVGGFSKDALSKYMDACVAKGFDQNVNRTEDLFEASNKKGYKVQLKYEGFSQVYIYIEAPIYKITLDCTCVENWIFSIYDLKIYVEGNLVGTLDHGHKEKYDISLVRGTYEIRIEKSDDSEIYETVEFNAVKDDTIKLKVNCHSSYIDVDVDTENAEVAEKSSDESSEDEDYEEESTLDGIKAPYSSYTSENYKEVINGFKEAGFTNVVKKPVYDLGTGWFDSTKIGETKSISIGGKSDFYSDDRFDENDKVVVNYHVWEWKNPKIKWSNRSASKLVKDIERNAMRAKKTYEGKYIKLTGRIKNIDDEGASFDVYPKDNKWALYDIYCSVDVKKTRGKLIKYSSGDIVTVKGKITSVGETLGYSMSVYEIIK